MYEADSKGKSVCGIGGWNEGTRGGERLERDAKIELCLRNVPLTGDGWRLFRRALHITLSNTKTIYQALRDLDAYKNNRLEGEGKEETIEKFSQSNLRD